MKQNIDDLKRKMEQFGDRFYISDNGINEVYWNTDATSGGQIVSNEISFKTVETAAQYENSGDFFDYLSANCKQYLTDIDEPGFDAYAEYILSLKPTFTECTDDTMYGILCETLYEKAKSEQAAFISELKAKEPQQIIDAAYEKSIRDDLLMNFEEDFLEINQLKELLKLDYPLSACYDAWLKTDVSHMEMLRDSVEQFADTLEVAEAADNFDMDMEM